MQSMYLINLLIILSAAKFGSTQSQRYRSHISIFNLSTNSIKELYVADDVWEAPNWSPDGSKILANSIGKLYEFAANETKATAIPKQIEVGVELNCNNDKTYSPDGQMIAFSASNLTSKTGSQIFLAKSDGTNRRLVIKEIPSYFHGWSPDSKWLAYVGQRNGTFNLFRVNATSADGVEERLTSVREYDDGPDYSVDGKWIYFNSNRTGSYEIWRMPPDGAGPNDGRARQVTNDTLENWFPHQSPDGKKIVYLSFPAGTETHNDRMDGMKLRLIEVSASNENFTAPVTLLTFFGGQGSINVNSWAPDSQQFAFVSFEKIN